MVFCKSGRECLKAGVQQKEPAFNWKLVEGVPCCMLKMPTGVYPYYLE